MYHSITFGDKNTWDDWHLVPSSRPLFLPPVQKTTVIDIPGFDGVIDLSTSLTKYPIYSNRTGTLEFIVMNGYEDWATKYSEIMNYLHGRTVEAILEDDPGFCYKGRFEVDTWESKNDGTWSTIKIKYDLEPYKLRLQSTLEDWLWDPFNFETGLIQDTTFKDIEINSENEWTEFDFTGMVGRKPIVPIFEVTLTQATITVTESTTTTDDDGNETETTTTSTVPNYIYAQLYNSDLGNNYSDTDESKWKKLYAGSNEFYDWIFCELYTTSVIKMKFKGLGKVSINFRSGGL